MGQLAMTSMTNLKSHFDRIINLTIVDTFPIYSFRVWKDSDGPPTKETAEEFVDEVVGKDALLITDKAPAYGPAVKQVPERNITHLTISHTGADLKKKGFTNKVALVINQVLTTNILFYG